MSIADDERVNKLREFSEEIFSFQTIVPSGMKPVDDSYPSTNTPRYKSHCYEWNQVTTSIVARISSISFVVL